ncbi:putative villin/Gelsolin, ADF-H/Gelsolin-like domain superfamily [Helianthus annuus]|nr:putative villin/Gelsolin, ADF-H/Gelsolin-like domain superfamily [Helianthus annuus]
MSLSWILKIFQFNGANLHIQERAKALEVIQFLKDKYHEGKCDVAIVGKTRFMYIYFNHPMLHFYVFLIILSSFSITILDDGKLQAEGDSGEFWVIFGGFAPIGKKVASEDDATPEETPPKPYCIANGQVKDVDGELLKSLLENNKCYL